MAEFLYRGEKIIGIDESITLENNTDTSFDVGVGIIFWKSGLYRVSVDGKHVSVKIEPERKKGKWLVYGDIPTTCSCCHEDWDKYVNGDIWYSDELPKYCPSCGCQMIVGEEE